MIVLGCISTLFLVLSCQKKILKINDRISFDSEKNIVYGKDSEQVMDFYVPHEKTTKKRDVFVMIHGGGWRGGDKSQLTLFTLSMMRQFPDMIFANVNYRLASEARYGIPNQTDDLKTAMLYLEKRLHYKPKFILLGNSAGGHLSMLYAYQFDQEKKVKAVINIVGPADLSDSGFRGYEDYAFVEKHLIDPSTLTSNSSITDFASPVHWIDTTSAPTLSYYGTADRVVPLSQKAILDSTLSKNNVIHKSYEFNGGHLDWSKEPHDQFLINIISDFLKRLNGHKKTH